MARNAFNYYFLNVHVQRTDSYKRRTKVGSFGHINASPLYFEMLHASNILVCSIEKYLFFKIQRPKNSTSDDKLLVNFKCRIHCFIYHRPNFVVLIYLKIQKMSSITGLLLRLGTLFLVLVPINSVSQNAPYIHQQFKMTLTSCFALLPCDYGHPFRHETLLRSLPSNFWLDFRLVVGVFETPQALPFLTYHFHTIKRSHSLFRSIV